MISRAQARHDTPDAGPHDAGLPGNRSTSSAARRSFVAFKRSFLDALDGVPAAAWLVIQIEGAEDPVDLWLLRAPVFSALDSAGPAYAQREMTLLRDIDSLFPNLDAGVHFPPR